MAEKTKASPAVAQDLLASFVGGLLNKFETDKALETEKGVDIEVKGYGTFTVLRQHARNQKWVNAYRERVLPYLNSLPKKPTEAQENRFKELELQVFADFIIVGLKTTDGQVIDYDDKAKTAIAALLAKTPDLYDLLKADAADADNFRLVEEKN